jgi:alpha-beta hydrolase superfamily lysophospholipase
MRYMPKKLEVSFLSGKETICGLLFIPDAASPVPALVVCHGALDFKENYIELCEFLGTRNIAALAIDMHGHGSSGGRRLNVTIADWISDVRCAVDYLELRPDINARAIGAFGLSSGGTAVLESAVLDERIRCVVSLDATVRNTLTPMEYIGMRLLDTAGRIKRLFTDEDLRISMVGPFSKVEAASDPEVNRRWRENPKVLAMWSAFPLPGATPSLIVDTIRRVPCIKAPTLVIHGEDDRVDPVRSAHLLFDALTCVKRLCIVPGNGHMGHLDRNRQTVMSLTAEWALTHLV